MKKQPIYDQGILIVKPWSKDMYDHNNKVADEMKLEIFTVLSEAYENDSDNDLRFISKCICAYGFGDSYSLNDIYQRSCQELDDAQNY